MVTSRIRRMWTLKNQPLRQPARRVAADETADEDIVAEG